MAHLLAVQGDPDVSEALVELLVSEGYEVTLATSLAGAREAIDAHAYDLVLTDLFPTLDDGSTIRTSALHSVLPLLAQGRPTPVAILTAWPTAADAVIAHGFACLIRMPFEVGQLLSCVASSLATPLTTEQQCQAETTRAYFTALEAGDAATLERVCAPTIQYVTPRPERTELAITGRDTYIAYALARREDVPGVTFAAPRLYGLPHRLAARFEMRWRNEAGVPASATGTALLTFDDEGRITHIRLELNPLRLPPAS